MPDLILIGLIGLVVSFLSNISGGGGSLIFLPLLILLGLSPLDAIGTIKVGTLGLVAGSIISSRDKKVVRKDFLFPLLIIVGLASLLGPFIALNLPSQTVKFVSSFFIILAAIASLLSWKLASRARNVENWSKYLGYILYFTTTLLLAGFGSGIGLLSNYIIIGFLGLSALETISTRRFTGIVGTPIQLVIFALSGHVLWASGLALMIGSFVGGYYGLNFAIAKGNEFLKRSMAFVSIILVLSIFV